MSKQLNLFSPIEGLARRLDSGKWLARIRFSAGTSVEQEFDTYSQAWRFVMEYFSDSEVEDEY